MNYHPSFAARVRDLSFVGASDAEIARLIGVSVTTLKAWAERYPDFAAAWEDGKIQADAHVAAALFKRAIGYEKVKWKETKDGMMRELVHYPPDVSAGVFWLTNRRPDLWKRALEPDAGSNKVQRVDSMTDIEAARRIAFALSKGNNDIIEGKVDGSAPDQPETE